MPPAAVECTVWTFVAELVQWEGPAAWHFIRVPSQLAPDFSGACGRVPVTATVDWTTWSTSVWHGKDGRWLLPVPGRVRGAKADGASVTESIEVDASRL